jgi:UDP-glucose 4-epimerase
MDKIKCIVTGGAGFIGHHLVTALCDTNHHVVVIDDLSAESNDKFHFDDRAEYIKMNINDEKIWSHFIGTSYIFHLAAESRIGPCINNPEKAAHTNIMGTLKLLKMSKKYGIKRFIYSSTSSVYGLDCELPTNETQPINCLNPYATTKYCGEELVKVYSHMYDLDSCIFRYFNVYGEDAPSGGQYAPVTGIFIKQYRQNLPLTVTGIGDKRRDFIHVNDVVEANILAMKHPHKIKGEVFNIGGGTNISIIELASIISNNIKFISNRPGEASDTLANYEKFKTLTGWTPTIKIKDWIKEQIELNKT